MNQNFRAIAVLATITFIVIGFLAAHFGLLSIKAMQENYINMSIDKANTDFDKDGIADHYDDSDGDTIPDRYDATPYGQDVDIFEVRTRKMFNPRQRIEPVN